MTRRKTGNMDTDNQAPDGRFEDLPEGFHRRVREGYLAQVAEDPERWTMIDGTMPLDQIHEAIWEKILRMMKRRHQD